MINLQEIEKSKQLNERTKAFFIARKLPDCVIEISNKPMSEWTIHSTPTEELMVQKRIEQSSVKKPFIAIYTTPKGTHFFFTDYITITLEIVETKELIFSNIVAFEEFDRQKVVEEFRALGKILQGR